MNRQFFARLKTIISPLYLLVIVLFTLTVSTSFMSIGYMAKYATSAKTNPADARVAKFNVSMTPGEDIVVPEDPSDDSVTKTYTFTVHGAEEVATTYTLTLKLSEYLPHGMTITMGDQSYTGVHDSRAVTNGGEGYVYGLKESGTNPEQKPEAGLTELTFTGGDLGPGESRTHTLTITADYTDLLKTYDAIATMEVQMVQVD